MKIIILLFCVVAGFSCTGVKNMSGSLSKSDGARPAKYARHGDYLDTDSINTQAAYSAGRVNAATPAQSNSYRKDYSQLSEMKTENQTTGTISSGTSDYNQKLVNQYIEMDKLADVILYELDITDRRWTVLLEQYKKAGNNDRQLISRDLDKLQAEQLMLYKLYTKVYKNGKSDWPGVKEEVDAALITLRGFDKK